MLFNTKDGADWWAEKLGFFFSWLVFTCALFVLLSFLGKLPLSWSFFHIAGITISIVAVGSLLKVVLE